MTDPTAWFGGFTWAEPSLVPERPERPEPDGRTVSACSRQVGFSLAGVDRTDHPDHGSEWAHDINRHAAHAWTQQAADRLRRQGRTVDVDVEFRAGPITGRVDLATIVDGDVVEVVILRIVGGWRFKNIAGLVSSGPEGPEPSAVRWAALAATALRADRARIVYVATEPVSAGLRAKYDADGWFADGYPSAEFVADSADLDVVATDELARLARLAQIVNGGELPGRVVPWPETPVGAVVTAPKWGTWQVRDSARTVTAQGTIWACDYCGWRALCAGLPDGRVALADVHTTTGGPAEPAPRVGVVTVGGSR